MRRRNFISPLVLMLGLLFVMFITSCGKDGATGPAGPAGDSSTVIYSDWLDVTFKPDTLHNADGSIDTIGYDAIIDAPKLTQEMLGTADVKVYINGNDASDPVIYPLPYNNKAGLYINVTAYLQKIELYSNGNVSTVTDNGKKYQQYRYMIVPGNTQARSAASIDWSDYAAVKAHLGLKD